MTAHVPIQARPLTLRSAARSHVGHVRADNEDRVLDRPEAAMWAVADGMGGHRDGAGAAGGVIAALAAVHHGASAYQALVDMADALDMLNETLRAAAVPGGSTVVALLIHERHAALLWAGDSRAYRLRDGVLEPLTRDHSVVQQLVDARLIAEDERVAHPQRHVITRAVGVEPALRLDRQFSAVAPGDRFLLCSDGLLACLSEQEIAARLRDVPVGQAAEALLAAALAREAPDNVSFVIVAAD